jgi:hypothetical protein
MKLECDQSSVACLRHNSTRRLTSTIDWEINLADGSIMTEDVREMRNKDITSQVGYDDDS